MGLFDSRQVKEKKSNFCNLVAVAAADGVIQESELSLLGHYAVRLGLEQAEVDAVLKNPASIKFVVPKSEQDKMQLLADAVSLMMIDGEIDAREKDLCTALAMRMGFRPSDVDGMIMHIVATVNSDRA